MGVVRGMVRRVLTVGVVVVAVLLAVRAGSAVVDTGGAAAAAPGPLYGFSWQGSLNVVRVDRRTLRPLARPRVPLTGLTGEPLGWSLNEDRSRLAMGSAGHRPELHLVGLRPMRALGGVKIARRGSLVATAWAGARRVLAVVVTPGCCGAGDTVVVGVDSDRRRVAWRRRLDGSLQAGERVGRTLLLVLGPRERWLGPSRLVEVRGDGRLRFAALPEIRSGSEPPAAGTASRATRVWNPGLAVDKRGGRAYVVQAQAPVAQIELSTFQVRSHVLQAEARSADAVVGPTRHALWLGHGRLAVTGVDERPGGARPAGLTLIDTGRWRARTIDRRATDATLVSGTLLASSFLSRGGGGLSGTGLTGYTTAGRRMFHRFGRGPIFGAETVGRRALVGGPKRTVLIDARTGRVLRSYRRFWLTLLSQDQPIY